MGKLIVLVVVIAAAVGGYFVWKNDGDVKKAVDEVKKDAGQAGAAINKGVGAVTDEVTGYTAAKTPKEAADLFSKAIKDRSYNHAAKYCTPAYAEELKKSDKAAKKLGKSIDNLTYQMGERSVMNDEMKLVLFAFDPFPKNIIITVEKETDKDAIGVLTPELPKLTGQQQQFDLATWKIDDGFFGALYSKLYEKQPFGTPLRVKMKKDGEDWKFDFPDPAELQKSVIRLNEHANYYSGLIDTLSKELKNEPETQENFKKRLKELFEDGKKHSN